MIKAVLDLIRSIVLGIGVIFFGAVAVGSLFVDEYEMSIAGGVITIFLLLLGINHKLWELIDMKS